MATRVSAQTGNWDATSTWVGGIVPVTGDFAQISGDHHVTVPPGVTAACLRIYINISNNVSDISTLIVNGNIVMDTSGQLRIGQGGANQDGKIVFGPDGSISGGGTIYFNNGYMASTATKGHMFKLTTSGGIDTLATGPRQDCQLSYVVFNMAAVLKWYLQNTVGSATSTFIVSNCVFVGSGSITVGTSTTPAATAFSITNCDFRDLTGGKALNLVRIAGGTGLTEFKGNTLYQTSPTLNINMTGMAGMVTSGNFGFNACWVDVANSGNLDHNSNFWATNINTPTIWSSNDASQGSRWSYNYLLGLAAGDNTRGLIPSGTGGSGTNEVDHNVLDGPSDATHDKPDLVVARGDTIPIYVHHNINLGAGEIIVGGRVASWTLNITNKNNTIAGRNAYTGAGVGHIFVPEGIADSGTINIVNSLVYGNGKLSDATIEGAGSGSAQAIAHADYGNYYNMATPYTAALLSVTTGNTGLVVPGAHETNVDPQFFDDTRSAATWDKVAGTGAGTSDGAIAYFAAKNGYRGSPNFDQNGPIAAFSERNMLDWVRDGYRPRNLALRGAGDPADGSPDVGAMPVTSGTAMLV